MKISSPIFAEEEMIPTQYTCDGENISPPLLFLEVPNNAKSLVLIVDDPDAPSKTWVHWLLANIPPEINEVTEGSIPLGSSEGTNDSGSVGYEGPCPPDGTHRYFFRLYALDYMLELPEGFTREQLEQQMKDHILEQTHLMGLYERT